MRADLTERLLRLGAAEQALLQDLYQVRFATRTQAEVLALVTGGSLEELALDGFLREVTTSRGAIFYLGQTGMRAALALLGAERGSGARAYAALRLGHELRRSELYLALRRLGMPAVAYTAEPRLGYRSAAGLGERTLVPDALVRRPAHDALVEVDCGTEGREQLRHKWLRYREWLEDAPRRGLYVLAEDPRHLEATLAAAGLKAKTMEEPGDLAREIWCEGVASPA